MFFQYAHILMGTSPQTALIVGWLYQRQGEGNRFIQLALNSVGLIPYFRLKAVQKWLG